MPRDLIMAMERSKYHQNKPNYVFSRPWALRSDSVDKPNVLDLSLHSCCVHSTTETVISCMAYEKAFCSVKMEESFAASRSSPLRILEVE